MICLGCNKNNIHPRYSYCDKCTAICKCGCTLQKHIIENIKNSIDLDRTLAIKRFLNYNVDNMSALKMVVAYVNGHCPEYIDVGDKFMVLK